MPRAYGGAVQQRFESLWERVAVCLAVSALGFAGGGALVFAAIREIGSDDHCRLTGAACHDPLGWLVIACSAGGFALFAVGAAAWFRAVQLVARSKARRTLTG
jgi:hypothetical protein